MKTEDWLPRFQEIASLHVGRFVQPSFDGYERLKAHKPHWQALKLFVRGFAFEHSGRVPLFPLIAEEVCKDLSESWSLTKSETAGEVWDRFTKRANEKRAKTYKFNPMNNPLAPRGTKFTRKGKNYTAKGISVIEFAKQLDRADIIGWTVSMLTAKPVKVEDAHKALKGINGIGDKIASLWLRDVACHLNIIISDKDLRRFLFPVDIWVRRTVAVLSASITLKRDEDIAKWCIEECGENFSPEKVNMGLWYFGAQIAENEDLMENVLKDNDPKRFDELVSDHLRRIRGAVEQYDSDKGLYKVGHESD